MTAAQRLVDADEKAGGIVVGRALKLVKSGSVRRGRDELLGVIERELIQSACGDQISGERLVGVRVADDATGQGEVAADLSIGRNEDADWSAERLLLLFKVD